MWFNNCVGEKNYRYFIVSILATFSFAVVVIIHVTASSFGVDYSQGEEVIKIVFSWVAALMMAIFGFLLFNLIALHVYLNVHGLTTYQFLQMRKKEEEELKKRKEEREKTNKASNNKVMPMDIHGSSQSEESFANIKKIMVSKNEKLEQETPID
jgi:palmitoyltransferase ZDHHC1/11